MRHDEEFTKDAVLAYLGSEFRVEIGTDPPDYFVHGPSEKAGLEITQTDAYFVAESGLGNRRTVDDSLLELCRELKDGFEEAVPAGRVVTVTIKGPVDQFRRFRNELVSALEGHILSSSDETSVRQGVAIIRTHSETRQSGARIVGFVANTSSVTDLALHADIIISRIFGAKKKVFDRVNFQGPRWLGILNTSPLIAATEFREAVARLGDNYTFERAFLVSRDGAVGELLSTAV